MTRPPVETPFETNKPGTAARTLAEGQIDTLRKKGGLFVEAVRATRMPMAVSDPSLPGNPIVFANTAFLDLSGYSMQEVLGQQPHFMNGQDTDPDDAVRFREALEQDRDEVIETVQYRKDNSRFVASVSLSAFKNEDGRTLFQFLTYLDVTARVAAEQELLTRRLTEIQEREREREARLRRESEERRFTEERLLAASEAARAQITATLESIGDAFYALDADFRFTYVNAKAESMWGRPRETLIGRHLWSEFPQAVGGEPHAQHLAVMRDRRPAHFEGLSPVLGRWMEASVYPDPASGGLACYFRDITERRAAEAALRESEAHLGRELEDARVLQKISNELVSEAGPNGHYNHIVEVARALMRSDAASIQELDAADSRLKLLAHSGFHPESAAFWDYVDADVGTSCGRALTAQKRVVVPDMDEFEADPHDVAAYRKSGIMSVQSTPLVASSGRIVGMMSTHWDHPYTPSAEDYRFFDILARLAADFMERARAEAALRESEAKYRTLFESMGQGYSTIEIIHGPDGRPVDHRLIELNPAFERLTGIRVTDAIGRTATEVTPGMDPWWFETYDRIAHQGYPERVEYELTAVGRWYEAHCFPQGGERLTVLYDDITERKRAEAALRESEEKFRAVFENMIEACCIFEMIYDDLGKPVDWKILEANAGYEKQSGLKDVAGKLASEVMPGTEPYWIETFARVAETGEAEQIENWHQPTGRWIHSSTARVGGSGSRRLLSVFYDITARKRAEETLRESEERQAFLLKLSDVFRANPGEDAVGRACVQALAEYMGLERCYITQLSSELNRGLVGPEYYEPSLAPIAGEHRYSNYPNAVRGLMNGEPLISSNVDNDERLSDTDKASIGGGLGLQAILVASLYEGEGNSIWALTVGSAKARAWTDEDVRLVQDVTERTWAAIERARTQRLALERAERLIAARTSERDALHRQLAKAEEAERQRLSRELHDQLGQQLTAFRLGLEDAGRLAALHHDGRRSADAPLSARIEQLQTLTDTMIRGARYIALELRPPELDDAGLASALETYLHEWSTRYGIAAEVSVTPSSEKGTLDQAIPRDAASVLYRIAQEGLTNIAKHAQATHVSIVVNQRDSEVRLVMEDNGKGFDIDEVRTRARHDRRLGLDGMEERAALLGGTLSIESTPASGTTLYVRLPLIQTA